MKKSPFIFSHLMASNLPVHLLSKQAAAAMMLDFAAEAAYIQQGKGMAGAASFAELPLPSEANIIAAFTNPNAYVAQCF